MQSLMSRLNVTKKKENLKQDENGQTKPKLGLGEVEGENEHVLRGRGKTRKGKKSECLVGWFLNVLVNN